MQKDDLQFRHAVPEDDPRIMDVFSAAFGRDRSYFSDFWKWFNYTCPVGRNRTSVIEDPQLGRFAGSYSLLPMRLRFNSEDHNASLCTNVCVHPEYQRRGLFTRVGAYALEQEPRFDTPLSIGMPNAQALPGHLKVGWHEMGPLPFLVHAGPAAQAHDCRVIERFDERFDTFFQRVSARFSFLVLKDHGWMNWRLVDRPDRQYTNMVLERGGELADYLALKHFDDGEIRKSHIMDLQAEDDEAFDQLLAAAQSFADGRDELSLYSNDNDPYQAGFIAAGFEVREAFDRIIIHFNGIEHQAPENGAWWFCLADNDVY